MPSCVVPTCKNAGGMTKKQDGITFHLFPADEKRKLGWIKIIQGARLDEFWKPSSRSVICSIHFDEQYLYDTKGGLKRLRKSAIPTKHIALTPEFYEVPIETSKPSTSNNVTQPLSPARSNSEIGDVYVSDLEYVFDTPSEAILKSQLRRKQMFCERHIRRLKTVQQKYNRLFKKHEALKMKIKNLKNNRYINNDNDV